MSQAAAGRQARGCRTGGVDRHRRHPVGRDLPGERAPVARLLAFPGHQHHPVLAIAPAESLGAIGQSQALGAVIGQSRRARRKVDVNVTASTTAQVGSYYDPATERGMAWDDPDLRISWPIDQPIVSDRGRHHPTLAEIAAELPAW